MTSRKTRSTETTEPIRQQLDRSSTLDDGFYLLDESFCFEYILYLRVAADWYYFQQQSLTFFSSLDNLSSASLFFFSISLTVHAHTNFRLILASVTSIPRINSTKTRNCANFVVSSFPRRFNSSNENIFAKLHLFFLQPFWQQVVTIFLNLLVLII